MVLGIWGLKIVFKLFSCHPAGLDFLIQFFWFVFKTGLSDTMENRHTFRFHPAMWKSMFCFQNKSFFVPGPCKNSCWLRVQTPWKGVGDSKLFSFHPAGLDFLTQFRDLNETMVLRSWRLKIIFVSSCRARLFDPISRSQWDHGFKELATQNYFRFIL